MRVTILTIGSRGDVQPFLALGRGLEGSGHEVCLATHPKFEPLVERAGLRFAPLAEGRLSEGPQTAEGRRWMERDSRWMPTWVGFLRDARSVAAQRLADALRACAGAEAILAADLAVLVGWQMAEHFGVPLAYGRLVPPGPLGSSAPGPGVRVARQALWLAARPALGVIRRPLGLGPLPRRDPLADRATPVLCAWSEAVMPPPAPAGGSEHVTGFWYLDRTVDPVPPAGLEDFLAAGPAPVCIAFGSMLHDDRARNLELAVSALRGAGRRGVLIRDRHELTEVPPTVFALDTIDYGWLLPRCSAVVHVAGAGSTGAACRAGVPSIAVPNMTSQARWAERIHALGVGPEPIPGRELTRERLQRAIAVATADEAMRARAVALGERLRREDGVARAVAVLERHFGPARGGAWAGVKVAA